MAASRNNTKSKRKDRNKLLFLFSFLLFLFLILDFCVVDVDWRYNIINNPLGTLQVVPLWIAVVETICFVCLCSDSRLDSVFSTVSKKQGMFSSVWSIIKSCFIIPFSCGVFHVVTVLYGAPFFELVEETFAFAVLLSTLTALPCLAVLGTGIDSWRRVFAERRTSYAGEVCLQMVVLGSLMGAWLGAFPIPLDWERPWQEWPISVSIGALWGHTAGLGSSALYLMSVNR